MYMYMYVMQTAKYYSWVLENWNVIFPGAPPCPPQPYEFASSDYVRMELDMEIFEMLQETHGGWNPAMANVGVLHPHHLVHDSNFKSCMCIYTLHAYMCMCVIGLYHSSHVLPRAHG